MQLCPVAQTMLQPPQFFGSFIGSALRMAPLHAIWLRPHVHTGGGKPPVVAPFVPPTTTHSHSPPRHWLPLTQALLQTPQSLLSVSGFTQTPLRVQAAVARQADRTPRWRTRPLSQAWPQEPQFSGSEPVLAHEPLGQVTWGGWQVVQLISPKHWQEPPSQNAPEGHASPQPPQSLALFPVSMQTPLHTTSGGGQTTVWHWLLTHETPAGHAWLQAPQLFGSSVMLEQVQVSTPQQARSGKGQPHWPLTHCRPSIAQSSPQPPQLLGSVLGLMHWPLPQSSRGGRQAPLEQAPLEQGVPSRGTPGCSRRSWRGRC